jgi:hypothetical protein
MTRDPYGRNLLKNKGLRQVSHVLRNFNDKNRANSLIRPAFSRTMGIIKANPAAAVRSPQGRV